MINFDILKEKFNDIELGSDKLIVKSELVSILQFLKTKSEFDFNMLTSIMAVDYKDYIELTYKLYSVSRNEFLDISYNTENLAPSVVSVFKSAYFDECEIYDLFGVKFDGNPDLKRLYMPESWVGYPLLKSYKLEDERLAWNE